MTPLSQDYGPGTIAYRQMKLQAQRDRENARWERATAILWFIAAALFIAGLVAIQVLPAGETFPRENTLYPTEFSIMEDREQ